MAQARVETMSERDTQSIEDLLRGIPGVRLARGAADRVAKVRVDSRAVQSGDLFVAIPGLKDHGSHYINDALARGAIGVVTEENADPPRQGSWVVAENPRRAAALLSARAFGHPSRRLHVAGITGTNGKTTTTFLLRSIVELRDSAPR
jgi:UDP-N-acetylmuramoyl-L-alanyl-D-glutamate--2,6-diaminopimelate ligase